MSLMHVQSEALKIESSQVKNFASRDQTLTRHSDLVKGPDIRLMLDKGLTGERQPGDHF